MSHSALNSTPAPIASYPLKSTHNIKHRIPFEDRNLQAVSNLSLHDSATDFKQLVVEGMQS